MPPTIPPATFERRVFQAREVRVSSTDTPKLEGYAALFDTYSADMGFRERIAPGAFAGALERSDVRALFNHNPDHLLGRVKAGTLSLAEDETGLRVNITLPDTQAGRDVRVSVARGDLDQMSFGFTTRKDQWAKLGDEWVRTLLEIEELFDVSPVTFPAYPDTSVALRGLEHARAQIVPPVEDELAVAADLDRRRRRLALQLRA